MTRQDYTPIMNVLGTIKCTTCHPKSNLTLNREFELLLLHSRENFGMNFPEGDKYQYIKMTKKNLFFSL